jgi:hypothetical protein
MHRRARAPTTRPLTPEEAAQVSRLIDELWPGRSVTRQYVEWNQYVMLDWQPGSGPVSQVRLPLNYLDHRTTTPLPASRKDAPDVQFLTAIPAG